MLQRITETRYFAVGVNPFDVMMGNTPINPAFGIPAAYAYISYFFVVPLTFISDQTNVIFTYAIFDIFCLFAGLFLFRKLMGLSYSIIDPFILLIVLISILRLNHIIYLNYGIVSTFGLILTIWGIRSKSVFLTILGAGLTSLKPSLLLPLAIALFISKNFSAFGFIVLINLLTILAVSVWVDKPAWLLIEQLQQTQYYFSNQGFYRWEGIFLFARELIGKRTTIVGLCATIVLLFYYRKKIMTDPIILILLVITSSLCFFYNQEHAWTMAYPILAYCFFILGRNKYVLLPLIILMMFMWLPSSYTYFEAQGLNYYMPIHNLARFSLLLLATVWLVEARLKGRNTLP